MLHILVRESVDASSKVTRSKTIKRENPLTGLVRYSPYLLILSPIAVAFAYVHEYGVNVVFRDQWEMVTLFRKSSSGTLTVSDLWAQHNQHRSFFPRIAMLALGNFTRWNNIAEMYLILTCMLTTLVAIFLAFKRSVGPRLFLFVPVAFLVFSLRQYWNMLLGYQLNFVFVSTFGVLALYFLYASGSEKYTRLAFSAALASATVAAFSAIQGLFVWPAGLVLLFIAPMESRARRVLIGIWGVIGLGEWIAYFIDHETGAGPSPLLYTLSHPLMGVEHFVTLLGGSLFAPQDRVFAFVSGLLLAGLVAVALLLTYKSGERGSSFWIALLSFSLLTLVSITVGRAGLGIENALTSRYTTFSLLAVMGTYVMLAKLAIGERSRLAVASICVLCVLVLSSIPLSYYRGVVAGYASRELREEAALVLSTYESKTDQQLKVLHKRPEVVKSRAPILENLEYNVFSEP